MLALAEDDSQGSLRLGALEKGLAEHGWNARNIRIDVRYGAGDRDRLEAQAATLVASAPDLILAGGAGALQAVRRATRTIPIVMVHVSDPVASGFVASLERPGGNITGFAQFDFGLSSKWIQLLREVAPEVQRLLVLYDAGVATQGYIPAIRAGARTFGLAMSEVGVRTAEEIDRAIAEFARQSLGGLSLINSPLMITHRPRVVELAERYRLPAIYPLRTYAEIGGLMSYSPDTVGMYRAAAGYVDRILRGANPAELPVQQPTTAELVINLRTAKALGIRIPDTVLALADEVIE